MTTDSDAAADASKQQSANPDGPGTTTPATGTTTPPTGTTTPPTSTMTPATSTMQTSKSFLLRTRLIWFPLILIGVGFLSYLRYPLSESDTFYSTAASVIATLYVALALSVFATKDSRASDMTPEHWLSLVVASAGLMASLRGLSIGHVHHVWQIRLLNVLTVVGVTAAVLLVAERLVMVAGGIAGTRKAVFWTVLFIAATAALALLP